MFMMKEMLMLFLSVTMGYVLCVLAKRETGIMKTVGYTFGLSILVFTLSTSLIASSIKSGCMGKKFSCGPAAKYHTMNK